MLSSHEICPICIRPLLHSKKINVTCAVVDNKKMSFVESVCNTHNPDSKNDFPAHIFFQVTSLYGCMLYQKIHLTTYDCEVDINYTKHQSSITYLPKNKFDQKTQTWLTDNKPETIPLEEIILDLDYPKLENVIKRVKNLAPFL